MADGASQSQSRAPSTLLVAGIAAVALISGAGNSFTTKVLFDTPCSQAADGLRSRCRDARRQVITTSEGQLSLPTGINTPLVKSGLLDAGDDGVCESHWESTQFIPAAHAARHWRRRLANYRQLIIPGLLDLLSTALQTAATMFISAAVNATMRGSLLLFTALANSFFGVRDAAASRAEWVGIGISSCAVILVGSAAILNSKDDAFSSSASSSLSAGAATAVGVGLAVAGNVIQAVQVVFETKFLEAGRFSPNEVNTVEGVIGVVTCIVAMIIFQYVPGMDNGVVEDSRATLCCLQHTPALRYVSAVLWALFSVSTASHMYLSLYRGSNFRGFVLVARALLVWCFEFAAFYAPAHDYDYGAPWMAFSWLEACGFGVLVLGGVVSWVAQSRREQQVPQA